VALIYKPAVLEPAGAARVLANAAFTDPNGLGSQQSRPALAQTFRVVDVANPDSGSAFTAVVLHLKSRGSPCGAGDDDPVQGNCHDTRSKGIVALLDWLATDPTETAVHMGVVDTDVFILGDLNAYYQEDPLQLLYAAGYTNLAAQSDYSFVFGGNAGALDHILASPSLSAQKLSGGVWNINAAENALLDYNDTVVDAGEAPFEAKPAGNSLYAADVWRSSDHDPVVAAVDLDDTPTSEPNKP
jgi:predicted extracellular nuclease